MGSWGCFTDISAAAQRGIMMLTFIRTYDLCKSYKQILFCQTTVILLKTADTKFTFSGLIKLHPGHLKSKEIYISPEQWQDIKNMIKSNIKIYQNVSGWALRAKHIATAY